MVFTSGTTNGNWVFDYINEILRISSVKGALKITVKRIFRKCANYFYYQLKAQKITHMMMIDAISNFHINHAF